MISLECKLVASAEQRGKMDEAIRTAQFVRNRCLHFWMDGEKVTRPESAPPGEPHRRWSVSKNDVYKQEFPS